MLYDRLNLTETEKKVLWNADVYGQTGAYGRYIGSCRVEFLIDVKGKWAYKIHTTNKTGYETSPGFIESKFRFEYDGAAKSAAERMIDLYWMASNKND